MSKKKGKGFGGSAERKVLRCPYCGSAAVLRSADGIYRDNLHNTKLYVCSRYPACDAYVRVKPGSGNVPMGTMANGFLRALRTEAHRCFDLIHTSGLLSRQEAYTWLAGVVAAPMAHTHIGQLGEYSCQLVIEESKKYIQNNRARIRAGLENGMLARKPAGGGLYAVERRTASAGGG